MKKRKENINEILAEFQNCDNDKEIFANFDYLSSYNMNIKFIKDKLKNKYSIIQPPRPLTDKKYHFYRCKPPYQRNFAYYDQINYLESRVKDNYFPREVIADIIEQDKSQKRPAKIRLNTITSKFHDNNSTKFFFAYFPYNIGCLEIECDPNQGDLPDEHYDLRYKNYKISKRISSSPILQLSSCKNTDLLARTENSYYRLKTLDNNEKEDFIEMQNQVNFQWELLCTAPSPFLENRIVSLTESNMLYVIDDNKPEKIEIDLSFLIESKVKNSDKHHIQLMDSFSHPDSVLLSNFKAASLYDLRSKASRLILSGKNKDELQFIYSIKHLQGQYFMTSTEKSLNIYDVRYPGEPFLNFLHMSDENPINVLGVSKIHDPIQSDFDLDIDSFIEKLEKMNVFEQRDFSKNRLLYGFSTLKNGSSMIFPNKIFKKFEETSDLYFDIDEFDDNLIGMKSLGQKTQDFSSKYFKAYNHPRLLYSTNMSDEYYKIRGLEAVHFGNQILTVSNDSHNNLIIHSLREIEESVYTFENFVRPKATNNGQELDEWTDFNIKLEKKAFAPFEYKHIQEKASIDPKNVLNLYKSENPTIQVEIDGKKIEVPQSLDDVDVEAYEFNGASKLDPFDAFDLSDLAYTVTADEKKYSEIFKIVVKNRKSRVPTFTKSDGIDVVSLAKLEQDLEDNGFDSFKPKPQSNADDLLKGNPFVINQGVTDLLSSKW